MGVILRAERLRWEMARRGWGCLDLARACGLSHPTVSAALAGQPVSPRSLDRIARGLLRTPPIEGTDALLPPVA